MCICVGKDDTLPPPRESPPHIVFCSCSDPSMGRYPPQTASLCCAFFFLFLSFIIPVMATDHMLPSKKSHCLFNKVHIVLELVSVELHDAR